MDAMVWDGIEAVLFDMDGTLIDSTHAVEKVWGEFAVEHGVPLEPILQKCHGRHANLTIADALPHLSPAEVEEVGRIQLARECAELDGVVPCQGAHELLAELDARGVPWAVVTVADPELAEVRLGAAGIVPRLLLTKADFDRSKPAPDGYLAGAERVGVPIEKCLVVEDAPAGIEAGIAAGARVVEVGHGTTLGDLLAALP